MVLFLFWQAPSFGLPYGSFLHISKSYMYNRSTNLSRDYTCEVPGCAAAFTNIQNLRRHQTNKHGRAKKWKASGSRDFEMNILGQSMEIAPNGGQGDNDDSGDTIEMVSFTKSFETDSAVLL